MPEDRLKVLIADDHPLVIAGIRRALEHDEDIDIVGEAHSGSELLQLVERRLPGVVLMDLKMPGVPALECIQRIAETWPENARSPSMNTTSRNNSIIRAVIAHHTIKTHLRNLCSIGRGRHLELSTPGHAADERRTSAAAPAPGLKTPTAEAQSQSQLNDIPNTLATGLEQALRAFGEGDVTAADVRLTLYKDQRPADATLEPTAQPGPAATARAGDSVPMLRWMLTEATDTIASVAHELETRAAEIDEDARVELRDDLIAVDEEFVTVKALLDDAIDWDDENRRLLAGEIPPLESEPDDEEDA